MKQVHIVDGNNWFSRMYFTGSDNFSMLFSDYISLRQKYRGRHIFVFDTCKSERRLALYPEYKEGRKSSLTEEQSIEFKKLLNVFMNVLKFSGVSVLEGGGYEADDYISMLTQALKRSQNVLIHSTDADFLQLVSENVSVCKPYKGEHTIINNSNFTEHTGVDKKFFIDYKSLIGDKSDNIPGIPGIGEKTAQKYINLYGSYKEIVAKLLNQDKVSKTEMKFIDGEAEFNLAKSLVDLSIVLKDDILKNRIKNMIKSTSINMEELHKLLSDNHLESEYTTVKDICKTFQ